LLLRQEISIDSGGRPAVMVPQHGVAEAHAGSVMFTAAVSGSTHDTIPHEMVF